MSNEPLACPFCGGNKLDTPQAVSSGVTRVSCRGCGGASGARADRAHAIDVWNRRPPPAPIAARGVTEAMRELLCAVAEARREMCAGIENREAVTGWWRPVVAYVGRRLFKALDAASQEIAAIDSGAVVLVDAGELERLRKIESLAGDVTARDPWRNLAVKAEQERDAARSAFADSERERDANAVALTKAEKEIADLRAALATAEKERDENAYACKTSRHEAHELRVKLEGAENELEELRADKDILKRHIKALRTSPPAPVDVEKLAYGILQALPNIDPDDDEAFMVPKLAAIIRTHLARGGTTDVGGVEGHAAVHGESRRLSPTANAESVATGSDAGTIAPSVTHGPHREDAAGIKPGPMSVSPAPLSDEVYDDQTGRGPCGGKRCWRTRDGRWIHSSKSYGTCSERGAP